MIKNQKQAAIVKKEIIDLQDLIKNMEKISSGNVVDFKQQIQLDIFKSRVKELDSDIKEYESLISQNLGNLEITHESLHKAIISFRIASGLTQKDIADKLEIQEQQIQRYEQNDYLTASFERIIQILQTLEVEVSLKKKFQRRTTVIDYSKFLIPKEKRENLESSIQLVFERKQLVKIGN